MVAEIPGVIWFTGVRKPVFRQYRYSGRTSQTDRLATKPSASMRGYRIEGAGLIVFNFRNVIGRRLPSAEAHSGKHRRRGRSIIDVPRNIRCSPV